MSPCDKHLLTKRQSLEKKGEYDVERTQHLREGGQAIKAVILRVNAAIERAKMDEEVVTLVELVDDWKGHKLESFGRLVLNGAFPVLKGEGSKETSEREVCSPQIFSTDITGQVSLLHTECLRLPV
jgi:hypothetical protein